MKYEKKSSEGTDWVYLNKSGTSIGVRNFWVKLEERTKWNSKRLEVKTQLYIYI
jgi:hypothetical protein